MEEMVDWPPDRPETPHASGGHQEELEFPGRRSFFGLLLGVGGVLVGALLSVPLLRFILFPVFHTTTVTKWASAGPMSDFASLSAPDQRQLTVEQIDAWRELSTKKSVFVIPWKNTNGQVRVLSSICPHLGCMVHYNSKDEQFHCPCHGSIFAADGSLVRGPAQRGLDPLPHKIQNGKLMVLFEYFEELVSFRKVIR